MKKRYKFMLTCLLCAVVCAAVHYANAKQGKPETPALLLADESARTAWLEIRGWQVTEPAVTQMRIPEAWQTQQGQSWLRLQAAQGLHPEDYAGCDAVRYLYPVTNAGSEYVYAELILCEDVLIGAQVYDASTQLMQSVI